MIDYFALALTHGLLLVAVLRLLGRPALDHEDVSEDEDGNEDEGQPAGETPARRRGTGRRRA